MLNNTLKKLGTHLLFASLPYKYTFDYKTKLFFTIICMLDFPFLYLADLILIFIL